MSVDFKCIIIFCVSMYYLSTETEMYISSMPSNHICDLLFIINVRNESNMADHKEINFASLIMSAG